MEQVKDNPEVFLDEIRLHYQLHPSILLIYPLTVLATNRALSTVISRKTGRRTILSDLIDTYKVGKFKALYAGLVPTLFFYVLTTSTLESKTRNKPIDYTATPEPQ